MKKTIAAIALCLAACNPMVDKAIVKSVVDVGLAECISNNAAIQDIAALKEICKWTDDLWPIVEPLIAARKKGIASYEAAHPAACAPSGGK